MNKRLSLLAILGLALALGGCATHAEIKMPAVSQVSHAEFDKKSMSFEIFYSQPKPGIISGGEQMPLVPFNQAEFSVASAATLKKLPDYIFQQLPSTVKRADGSNSDFKIVVALIAHDKKGPAYADYEAGKSFGKSLLTLGLASSEYNIVADFDVKYSLYSGTNLIFSKNYTVKESVDHERGTLEGFNSLNDFAGQLLEKHIILTLNNFFKEASANLQ